MTPERRQPRQVDRRVGMLMAFEAATLAVAATVHLAGYTPAGSKPPFDASHAGVAYHLVMLPIIITSLVILLRSRRTEVSRSQRVP